MDHRYQELEEKEALARFDRLVARLAEQNAGRSDEEMTADVEAALTEARR